MKITLVHPPFVLPMSVPPGMGKIKAYVEAKSPHSVDSLDLNLVWHEDVVARARAGVCNFEVPGLQLGEGLRIADVWSRLAVAYDFFRSPGPEFFDQETYARLSTEFIILLQGCHGQLNRSLVLGTPVPDLVADIGRYVRLVLDTSPDVVGFSLMFDRQINFALYLGAEIKRLRPSTRLVFGGIAATQWKEALAGMDVVDFVVQFDGERALATLLDALAGDGDFSRVPNLCYRGNGERKTNPVEFLSLDEFIPPDYTQTQPSRYFSPFPVVSILASKGCFWKRCSFCDIGKMSDTYLVGSVDHIVDEMERHVADGIRHFHFVDEMLSANLFRRLAREILRRGLSVDYYAYARPTRHFNRETLELIAASGCRYIVWGVESAHDRVLGLIEKGTNVADMTEVLRASAASGIRNHTFVIVGFPSETKEELQTTMSFLYDLRESIHGVHTSQFQLNQHTPIFDNPSRYGITAVRPVAGSSEVDYDVASGLSRKEAARLLDHYSEIFLNDIAYAKPLLQLRDHALILYGRWNELGMNPKRREPRRPEPPTAP